MLTEERKQYILEQLEKNQIIKVQDLIQTLDVSESTIRRDLQDLETEGLLQRIHGGAKKILKLDYEQDMQEKSSKNVHAKQLIAEYAASTIREDDVIYLDAGSTTYQMIPFLKERKILVVTNSVHHASALVDYGVSTIIIGGTIKLTTKAVLGAASVEQLKNYRFNKAYMGMNGAHSEHGFTTPDVEEAAIKKAAMKQAEDVFVLVDESKFEKMTFTKVAPLEDATIITDACPKSFLEKIGDQTIVEEVGK